MKTKIKILIAILCLTACTSCRVFSDGAHYRNLNKVPVYSQKSAEEKTFVSTDSIEEKEIAKLEWSKDGNLVSAIALPDSTIKDTAAKTAIVSHQKKQRSLLLNNPYSKMNFKTTAGICRKSNLTTHHAKSYIDIFSICFAVAILSTFVGFLLGWSGAWIMLILIGVVLPVIILFVWILLIFSAFNQNYSWGNS